MSTNHTRDAIRGFAGEVLMPGDSAYEPARRVQSDAIDRWPVLIARCTGSRDVAAALRHARDAGLPVTIRGGGHGPDGFASRRRLRGADAVRRLPGDVRVARAVHGPHPWRGRLPQGPARRGHGGSGRAPGTQAGIPRQPDGAASGGSVRTRARGLHAAGTARRALGLAGRAAWFEPSQDAAVQRWMAGLREALARWSRGEPYPNFMPATDPARLRASYGPAVWQRLQEIRATWDPDGVFAAGHAIALPRWRP